METVVLPAKLENLEAMISFIKKSAEGLGLDAKKVGQIQLAAEEILINVINYAYPDTTGDIEITCSARDGAGLAVSIADSGIAFNPLELPEPNINTPVAERKIGGLGIFLVRKTMDQVTYTRQDNRNILTFTKQ